MNLYSSPKHYSFKVHVSLTQKCICSWSGDPTTRHSVWSLVIGSVFGQLTIYAANQTMIQRYLAIKEIKNSQRYKCTQSKS